jgi:hypothetical protein
LTVATYDAAGRVKCEAKPGQSCAGASPVPSVEYAYVYGDPSAGTFEGKLSYVEAKTREPNNTTGTLPGYLLTRSYFDALGRERATATWPDGTLTSMQYAGIWTHLIDQEGNHHEGLASWARRRAQSAHVRGLRRRESDGERRVG